MRDRNVSVLRTLAAMDVDHHTATVDIRNFEVPRFLEPETAGIDRGEEGVIVGRRDAFTKKNLMPE